MKRWLLVGVLIFAACSSGNDKPAASPPTTTVDVAGAETELRLEFQQLSDGQFGPLYETLHPAQQALVDKDTFVTCYAKIVPAGRITDVKFKAHYQESTAIPGTDLHADSLAITTDYTLNGQKDTGTFHEILVAGRWRWTFDEVDTCKSG